MQVIDLSMLIQEHWRWPVALTHPMDFDQGDPYRASWLTTSMHAFTHIDAPLHIEARRHGIDQVDLNALCGMAALVDLTPVKPLQQIDQALLESRWSQVLEGDIVLLRTAWDLTYDSDSRDYWAQAPYVSTEAAAWLARQSIKAIGFDFPQDYTIREIPERHPQPEEMPTHHLILRQGIYLIEYLCNLHAIKTGRCEIYALPLKVADSEGACARVVAVVR